MSDRAGRGEPMLFRWRAVVDRATNGDAVWEELPAGLVCAHLRGLGNKIQFFDDGRCGAWFRGVWHATTYDLAAALALAADEIKGPPPGGIYRIIRAVSAWGAMAAAIDKHDRCTWQDNGVPDSMALPIWHGCQGS